jgi:ribosomal protein S12 methylthiotransferase
MKQKIEKVETIVTENIHNVYIVTLGCPKNLVDTEVMTGALLTAGFDLTMEPAEADLYLINTCAFILSAREEAEAAIEVAIEWKQAQPKKRRIVIAGCLIQWDKRQLYREKYPEIDLWSGVDWVEAVGRQAVKLFGEKSTADYLLDAEPTYLYDENTPRLQLTVPHIAYVKIAEGCSHRCAYCSIPGIRGNLRSRTVESVVKEAENLRRNGVKELVLIAQDTSAYGNDLRTVDDNLPELLRRLNQLDDGEYWIRMLYTHPASFSDELIEAIAESEHILPYVDIPLQHIADPILTSMRRQCNGAQIRELLTKLRQRIPGIGLRTTFITGYPGETAEHFQELYDFIKEVKFERLGVFAYFDEPDTAACEFEDKVPSEVGEQRRDVLMELQQEISLNINKSFIGTELEVIIDLVEDDEFAVARSVIDAPEIDNEVVVRYQGELEAGDIIRVLVTEVDAYTLIAQSCEV